ncbi:hypothetical protein [Bradyrhizobium sp. CCBAU 51765]|uniref:hypothetical protein n=1 Tax=Bradyrhizobium sp. CCBAU 51765 TaxID=1325102 RepID=UPI0018873A3E|nr:hypothetical protein [Bradyrhizobium sp. CCBAU 51765]QOZ07884.1 hypothetical protein XH96_10370 [Bradyrhizobium sp. CCBAU 51765]
MRRVSSAAALSAVLTLLLAGCGSSVDLPPAYQPPQPPSAKAVKDGVTKAAAEAKLSGGLETSAVRHSDHGPGSYFVCLRQSGASATRRPAYSVFFDDDTYKGVQASVILEACEAEAWTPFSQMGSLQ